MQFQNARLHAQVSPSVILGQYGHVSNAVWNSASIPVSMANHQSSNATSTSTSVNIFIPTHLFSVISQGTRTGLLFGYQQQQTNLSKAQGLSKASTTVIHYNITALLPHNKTTLQQLIAQRRAVLAEHAEKEAATSSDSAEEELFEGFISKEQQILFLGELVDLSSPSSNSTLAKEPNYREQLETLKSLWPPHFFQLVLSFDAAQWPKTLSPNISEAALLDDHQNLPYTAIRLSSLQLRDSSVSKSGDQGGRELLPPSSSSNGKDYSQVTLLYYDTRNFMSSQLLNRFTSDDQRVDFLEFINESLKKTAQLVTTTTTTTGGTFSSANVSFLPSPSASIERSTLFAADNQALTGSLKTVFSDNKKKFVKKTPSKTVKSTNENQFQQIKNRQNLNARSCSCSWSNDPTFSTLMPLLLLPRSLIRAFLYFSLSNHRCSLNTAKTNQKWHTNNHPNSPKNNHDDHKDQSTLYPLVLQQWLLNPLAALTERMPLLARSATVTQLKFRLLQLTICWRLLRREILPSGSGGGCGGRRAMISLSLGNALSSVLVDVLLGVATIVALHYYSTPQFWLQRAWQYADSMVDDVDRLLRVLQSMPAGLKLNRPLNLALSQFYLYHIYLWESYMDIIRPVFGLVMQAIFYLGIFGFTCILSLLSDIFSLVTIHIYCFYGYGCQLYGLQVSGIGALWRLFRGKKYNQLRNRVDSYSYDNEQLFIGTILFTVLLFLLPTVFMYYLVFLVLRFLTLAVQEGLYFFIEHISSMPLYTLILWLLNSRTISGQVYLKVIDTSASSTVGASNVLENYPRRLRHCRQVQARTQQNKINNVFSTGTNFTGATNSASTSPPLSPMIVRLQTKRISLLSIITSRYDDMLQSLQIYRLSSSAKQLTWNEFFQSILSGRLLHQNLSIGLSLLLFIGYLLLIVYFALNSVST